MRKLGKACMSSAPCDICVTWWSAGPWQKVGPADLQSAKLRLSRAKNRLSQGDLRARTIKSSVSKITDRHSTGFGVEATLAAEARFNGGTRPTVGKPSGGAGRDTI